MSLTATGAVLVKLMIRVSLSASEVAVPVKPGSLPVLPASSVVMVKLTLAVLSVTGVNTGAELPAK